jgi:CBS-domain-containing membrane protein
MNVVAEGREPHTVTVETCMTTAVVTCSPNDSVEKTTELMKENQIRRVPVVDEQPRLQGIVSIADLVHRADIKTGEAHDTLKKVSAPTKGDQRQDARSSDGTVMLSYSRNRGRKRPVSEICDHGAQVGPATRRAGLAPRDSPSATST